MIRGVELWAPWRVSGVTVGRVTDGVAFAALREEWWELWRQSAAGPFCTWEWLYPWSWRIGGDRQLELLTARDRDGRLVGLLPLCHERRWVLGRAVRRLAFLGESRVGSDYLGLVAPRGNEAELAAAFAAELFRRAGDWDVLDLTDWAEDDPALAVLRAALAERFEVHLSARHLCPYERFVPGEGFEGFLGRTARRDNYLRRRKWLEKQQGYRVERVGSKAGLTRAMSEFFRLHALRWAEDGGSQGINGQGVEAFHRDAAALLAERGMLRIYTLWIDQRAVASVYGILHRDAFVYYQSGYDPAWRSKSVGLVLVGETFRDALAAGMAGYDFLRGTEPYKADWTHSRRGTVALRAFAPRGPGAWLDAAERAEGFGRGVARRLLPAGGVERLRRLRRRLAAI